MAGWWWQRATAWISRCGTSPPGSEIQRFTGGHTDVPQAVAFMPDGKSVLSGGLDDTMLLWDIASGKIIRRFENPTGDVNRHRCQSRWPVGRHGD